MPSPNEPTADEHNMDASWFETTELLRLATMLRQVEALVAWLESVPEGCSQTLSVEALAHMKIALQSMQKLMPSPTQIGEILRERCYTSQVRNVTCVGSSPEQLGLFE